MPTPQTVEDAQKAGHEIKSLSVDEAKKLKQSSGGALLAAHLSGCGPGSAGKLCWEGNCVDGWREVLYCDGTQGCTQYAKVPC